jgi:hypothetical protein
VYWGNGKTASLEKKLEDRDQGLENEELLPSEARGREAREGKRLPGVLVY